MERTVKVEVLVGVRGALANLGQLRQGVREFSSELQKAAVDRKATFTDIGFGLTALGTIIGGVTALGVKKFADFDQAMSYVAAVTRESAGTMDLLREAALKAGQETIYTAVESANAIEQLAKSGMSAENILSGGLRQALNLAASAGISVAEAAEIMAGAMGMFKIPGTEAAQVADMLSAAANKSLGEVTDLSYGLRQAGPVAQQTGLSLQETVAALAAFAATGRIGQDAGTSFKRMLQLLTPVSAAAEAEMEKLGIDAYDAQGNFIGLAKFAGVLRTALGDLTPEARNSALSIIYGSDAVAAATEIFNQGEEGILAWMGRVNEAGYASDNAALRLGNLKGDLEQLSGSVDTLMVTMGEAANGPLRWVVQGLTDLVNGLSNTSDEFQQSLFWFVTIGGAVTLFSGIVFLAIPRVAAFFQGVKMLTEQFPKLGAAMGAAGKAAGWIGVALTVISGLVTMSQAAQDAMKMNSVEMTNMVKVSRDGMNMIKGAFQNLDGMHWSIKTGGLTYADGTTVDLYQDKIMSLSWEFENFQRVLDRMGSYNENRVWGSWNVGLDNRIDRIRDLGQSFADLAAKDLPAAQESFALLFAETDGSEQSFRYLMGMMPAYKDYLTDLATTLGVDATDAQTMMNLAMGDGAEGAAAQVIQLGELSAAAEDSTQKIGDLAKEIAEFGKAEFDTRDAMRELGDSYRDLAAKITEARDAGASNADMLNLMSENGSNVTGAMDDYAASINNAAATLYSQTGDLEAVNTLLSEQRQQLFDMIRPLFDSDAAAQAYIDTLVATPEEIQTQVELNGIEDAQKKLTTWYEEWNGKRVQVHVDVNGNTTYKIEGVPGGRMLMSTGGTVRGPGTSTSDSIPMMLSTGEEVISAKQAAKYRGMLKAINQDRLDEYVRATDTRGFDGQWAGSSIESAMRAASPAASGDNIHLTVPIVPDPRQPVAEQLFTAARRMQVRLKARR